MFHHLQGFVHRWTAPANLVNLDSVENFHLTKTSEKTGYRGKNSEAALMMMFADDIMMVMMMMFDDDLSRKGVFD